MKKNTKQRVDCTVKKRYNPRVNFGKVKQLRKERGLTQTQATKAAGWKTQQQWADLEAGNRPDPRISTLVMVARVLGCKVADLLTE